jgi:hypothetical protein
VAVRRVRRQTHGHEHHLRLFHLNEGLPSLTLLRAELQDMWDVLLGRKEPPIPVRRVEALMEVADAYFARASEITAMIQRKEAEGLATPSYRKFRTGELRTFMDMAKRAADLGSRRITVTGQRIDAERTGRDTRFNN